MLSSHLSENHVFVRKQDCRVKFSAMSQIFKCSVVFYQSKMVQLHFLKTDIESYNFPSSISFLNSADKTLLLDLNYSVQLIQKQLKPKNQQQNIKFSTHLIITQIKGQWKLQIKWLQSQKSEMQEYLQECVWIYSNLDQAYEIVKQIKEECNLKNTGGFLLVKDLQTFENRFLKKYQRKKFFNKSSKQFNISSILKQVEFQNMIQHQNIMRYNKFIMDNDHFYLFFKQKPSKILSRHLKEGCHLSSSRINIIIRNLLEALTELEYVHIVHNNVRLSSVFLIQSNDNWKVCLGEFQYANYENENCLPKLLENDDQYFLAPQMIDPKILTDQSATFSDVYSLGVLFYELLFRDEETRKKIREEIMQQKPINFESPEFKRLPLPCVDLLKQMLQWDYEFRISPLDALDHGFLLKQQSCSPYHSMQSQDLSSIAIQTSPQFLEKPTSNHLKRDLQFRIQTRRNLKTELPIKKVIFSQEPIQNVNQRQRPGFYFPEMDSNNSWIDQKEIDDSHEEISLRDVRMMRPAWIVHQVGSNSF